MSGIRINRNHTWIPIPPCQTFSRLASHEFVYIFIINYPILQFIEMRLITFVLIASLAKFGATKSPPLQFMYLDDLNMDNPLQRKRYSLQSTKLQNSHVDKQSSGSLPFDINQLQPDPVNPNGPVTYVSSKRSSSS